MLSLNSKLYRTEKDSDNTNSFDIDSWKKKRGREGKVVHTWYAYVNTSFVISRRKKEREKETCWRRTYQLNHSTTYYTLDDKSHGPELHMTVMPHPIRRAPGLQSDRWKYVSFISNGSNSCNFLGELVWRFLLCQPELKHQVGEVRRLQALPGKGGRWEIYIAEGLSMPRFHGNDEILVVPVLLLILLCIVQLLLPANYLQVYHTHAIVFSSNQIRLPQYFWYLDAGRLRIPPTLSSAGPGQRPGT